jgi:hypothetical protein
MVKPENFLEGPIPGQSLTATPKAYKWERPPQMATVEEATKYYINKLADQDVMDDLAVLFDGGMPIAPFVQTLTTTAVSEGLHSIDVSLIVSPIVHAFLKAAMLEYGIEAKDDTYNPEKDPSEREKRRLMTAINLAMADAQAEDRTAATDKGVAVLEEVKQKLEQEDVAPEEGTQEEPAPEMAAPAPRRGLMAKETM